MEIYTKANQMGIVSDLEMQRKMVAESVSLNGGRQWFLGAQMMLDQGKPLTKSRFLLLEGLSMDLEDVEESLEELVSDGTLPDYYHRLPDE
jgi:hypothetical protein